MLRHSLQYSLALLYWMRDNHMIKFDTKKTLTLNLVDLAVRVYLIQEVGLDDLL